jgi:ferredoxin
MMKILKLGLLKKGVVTGEGTGSMHPLGRPCVEKCDRCLACVVACPTGAIDVGENVEIALDRCIFCRACEEACPHIKMTEDVYMASKDKEGTKVTY